MNPATTDTAVRRPQPAAARARTLGLAWFVATLVARAVAAQDAGFVNWESPHVHPLELLPCGERLAVVNTADACVEVFDVPSADTDLAPRRAFAVPTGLDPVSVRAEDARRVWVVNRVSDSVSVVDLERRTVVATLRTEDEPADVVFAGTPRRAFVTCSQTNAVLVFDPTALDAPPRRVAIDGEEPRALAVSPDGARVGVAIFASGNQTTILGGGSLFNLDFPPNVASARVGPYAGTNPPPNERASASIVPAPNPANPRAPKVGLIVRRDGAGAWRDDAGSDWTHLVSGPSAAASGRPVGWELVDHDVALVDANTLEVRYARHLMNTCAALAAHPDGGFTLVGTDAANERRFEPVVRGRFLSVLGARLAPSGEVAGVVDLNPHLAGAAATLPPAERARSLGDPRAIAWDERGERAYVAGMGSNGVVALDEHLARVADRAPLEVGAGPTGLAYDARRRRLYVACRFEATVAVVDVATWTVAARVGFHDATPHVVRAGRDHLFDTHAGSGQGQIACASCHVDTRMDHLAWDLGDPTGAVKSLDGLNQAARVARLIESQVPGRGPFEPFHPMKGPMTTQTLQDVVGHEPLHWRGDRLGLEEFAGAFATLQGREAPLGADEMQELEDYLATITFPPNPHRTFDNALPSDLPLAGHHTTGRFGPAGRPLPNGDARHGLALFRSAKLDNGSVDCITCHTLPAGYGTDAEFVDGAFRPLPPGARGERHLMVVSQDGSTNVTMKVPQLRNLYDKVGFDLTQTKNHFGFGFLHDGSVDSLARFVDEQQFSVASDQDTADLVAFLLAFSGTDFPPAPHAADEAKTGAAPALPEPPGPPSRDTHAAVGRQWTFVRAPSASDTALLHLALAASDAGKVGVIVKGDVGGVLRGWCHLARGTFASDRAGETIALDALLAGASEAAPRTWTIVPTATAVRLGVDRDLDGVLDGDELAAGTDPADATSRPSAPSGPNGSNATAPKASGASRPR